MSALDFDGIMRAAAEAKKTLTWHGFSMPVLNEIPTLVAEVIRLTAELDGNRASADSHLVRLQAADALADEVAALVMRRALDARSAVADALLNYRENPRSDRSDRIAALETDLAAARDAVFKEGLVRIEAEKQLAVERAACDGYRSDHRAESGSESHECFREDFVVAAYDTRCPKCREHDARRAVETKGPK